MWQTNAVALRAGERGDADRLALLPGRARGAARACWRGRASSRTRWWPPTPTTTTCSAGSRSRSWRSGMGEPSVMRLHQEPGAAQRELRDKDAELYVERPRPLALGHVQALPVPGSIELGSEELELHPAEGHTPDGMAVMARWCGVLCVGDYLSNVEIPMVEAGPRRLPRDARAAGAAGGGGGDGRARPRRAPRRGTERCASSTRTWTTWTRWSAARSARSCPTGRDTTRAAEDPRREPARVSPSERPGIAQTMRKIAAAALALLLTLVARRCRPGGPLSLHHQSARRPKVRGVRLARLRGRQRGGAFPGVRMAHPR